MLNSNSVSSSLAGTQQPVRHSRLATRLTAFILVVTVLLLIGVNLYVATQAGAVIENEANVTLHAFTERTEDTLLTWQTSNGQAVTGLAAVPGMSSMDATVQKPILVAMARAYPNYFLIHTVALNGANVARNDNSPLLNYADRIWFNDTKKGTPVSLDVVVSKTIGKPVIAIAAPIKDEFGNIVGVASGVGRLDQLSEAIGAQIVGKTGYVYAVDAKNQLVLHPDLALTNGTKLLDMSNYPPVQALRQGKSGIFDFTDDQGKAWRSDIVVLKNHWAVVAQEPQAELLEPLHQFQLGSAAVSVVGILVLVALTWLLIRQTLRPIDELTEIAQAIAAGELGRTANVASQDEMGALAHAFNTMTTQLRDLIGNLETRVKDRTAALEQANDQNSSRSKQLRSIAEITRAVSSIRSVDEFLPEIARQIGDSLGFSHVGIFLNDQSGEFVVLQASNSEAGRKMLARNFRVKVEQSSIVGFVASLGQARTAQAEGEDAHFFQENPDLADMRSEIALPLRLGENILGVLDLQSTALGAFTNEDIDILTLLADQVSITIQNNLSFDETRIALEKSEEYYQATAAAGWREFLHQGTMGYRFVNGRLESVNDPKNELTVSQMTDTQDTTVINIPIVIRGKKLGFIAIRQPGRERPWDENETRTLQAVVDRLSFALENARLYTDAQKRASKERVLGEISTKIRSSNDPNEMIRVAVDELKLALNLSDIRIVPYDPPQNGDGHKEG